MTESSGSDERIAKYLARAGVASRREVERMIEGGRVKVDGKTLDTPAFKVSGSEKIEVDGKPVEPPAATRLWRFHKPTGLVTTHADPEGRETVFDVLPKDIGRVISIGRLDLTSEGLLLLTNDGALARALELPSTGWMRRYRARAFGSINEAAIRTLRQGVTVDGLKYGPMEVEVERETGSNIWLNIGIREGKNREVRKALDAVGLKVNRLIRTAYGPFQLGDLGKGEVKSVPGRILRDQCGHLVEMEATTGEATAKVRTLRKPARRKMGGPGQPGRPQEDNHDGAKPLKRSRGRPAPAKRPDSKAHGRTAGRPSGPGSKPTSSGRPSGAGRPSGPRKPSGRS
ncbi:pseudouridine synthase [Maricaulis sp. CAU 1757]